MYIIITKTIDLLLSVNIGFVPSIISLSHWPMPSLYLFSKSVNLYLQTSYFYFLTMCSKIQTVLYICEYLKCRLTIKLTLILCSGIILVFRKARYSKCLFINETVTFKDNICQNRAIFFCCVTDVSFIYNGSNTLSLMFPFQYLP